MTEIQAKLDEIEQKDKDINSFIVLDKEGISRKDVKKGGRLDGLVVGVKSNICVQFRNTRKVHNY